MWLRLLFASVQRFSCEAPESSPNFALSWIWVHQDIFMKSIQPSSIHPPINCLDFTMTVNNKSNIPLFPITNHSHFISPLSSLPPSISSPSISPPSPSRPSAQRPSQINRSNSWFLFIKREFVLAAVARLEFQAFVGCKLLKSNYVCNWHQRNEVKFN